MVDIEKKQVPYQIQGDAEWAAELGLPSDALLFNSIQVLADEVKEFTKQDHVSIAVEPCRIVILYDPVSGCGLVGHFDTDGGEILYPQAESFFEDITRVEAIFAGGSGSNNPDYDDALYVTRDRAALEQGALVIGIREQNMYRNWSSSNTCTHLLFNPDRGYASILHSDPMQDEY